MEIEGIVIAENVITDRIKFELTEYRDGLGDYYWGCTVIYDDSEKIDFGSVLTASGRGNCLKGNYAHDNNYIYRCYENGDIEAIFDINNKREISGNDERDMIYDEFLSKDNRSLLNIRATNKLRMQK